MFCFFEKIRYRCGYYVFIERCFGGMDNLTRKINEDCKEKFKWFLYIILFYIYKNLII